MVFTSAKQLKLGPQVFPEKQPTSLSSQQLNKRYAAQEYKIYLSPDEIKALQSFKTLQNDENNRFAEEIQLDQQSEGELLKWYKSQFRPKVPQLGGLGAYGDNFDNYKSEANIPRRNFEYTNLYTERNPQEKTDVVKSLIEKANSYENNNSWRNVQEDNTKPENDYESAYDIAEKAKSFGNYFWQRQQDDKNKQESDLRNDSIQKSYRTISANNEDNNNLLNNKLQQQWNRILEHNRSQLKSIQSVASEPQKTKQTEKLAEQTQTRSEIEEEIDNILKSQRDFEFSEQSDDSQEEEINQRPPILIHREVSVTKHLPVPFLKKVKVSVPAPVLIPVPEPFEVKNPRLSSIPIQFLKYLSSER